MDSQPGDCRTAVMKSVTHVTEVAFLWVVCVHVAVQAVQIVEHLLTLLTLVVGWKSRMHKLVNKSTG